MFAANYFNGGFADLPFIDKEIEAYDIDEDALIARVKELSSVLSVTINTILETLYEMALEDNGISLDEQEYYNISIYTNYLDSHLYIDGSECYSSDDIIIQKERVDKEKTLEDSDD